MIVDFIERLRNPAKRGDIDQVAAAKRISAVLGVAVVVMSTGIGLITGNLLELAYKVVNLLTAPLFGLFFMAMFVRWATAFGTIVGGIAGLITVTLISYSEEFFGVKGLFMWAMPVGIVVQISTGCLFSLLGWDAAADAVGVGNAGRGATVRECVTCDETPIAARRERTMRVMQSWVSYRPFWLPFPVPM